MSIDEKPPQIATKTFQVKLYLRIMANKTLRPVPRRDMATYITTLEFEYPTYEEELDAKRNATIYDELRGIHFVDQDRISEWRVKRCLLRWNLHQKLKHFSHRLHRTGKMLREDSWEEFRKLPPLVRKEIIRKLWLSLGSP